MWRISAAAAAAAAQRTTLGAAASAGRSAATAASAAALPALLSCPPLFFARHGSSFTQSPRASRASSRASGSTYRKPKGREGDKNPWHVKEAMPDIPTFAEARLPPHIRRKLAAAARVKASHNAGSPDASASLLDFEVVDDAVQAIKGKDSRRPDIKRAKSPLHRAIKLEAARAQALRNKRAADAAGLEWDPAEQSAAESDADRFVELQALRDEIQLQREIMAEEMKAQGLSDEDAAKALQEFDDEAAEAMEHAEAEASTDADTTEEPSEDANNDGSSSTKRPPAARKPRAPKPPPAPPRFGVQTLLAFLAEYDFAVQLPDKHAAASTTTARGRKKRATAASSASTDLVAAASSSSLSADPSSRESLLANPLNQSVLVYDVATRFSFADFIVVVKTNSARQMRHIAEASYKMSRSMNACLTNPRVLSLEGRGREDWMLLDSGRVWVYFFNTTPAITLPPGTGGAFGMNFDASGINVNWRSDSAAAGAENQNTGMGAAPAALSTPARQLPFMFNQQHNSIEFVTHTTKPSVPSFTPAGTDLHAASYSARQRAAASGASPAALAFDEDTLPHETASQINDSMWFEPTPDLPAHRKKSQLNMKHARAMMHNSLDDAPHASQQQQQTIDVAYRSLDDPSSASSPSSTSDPLLADLHSSRFTHPVLENLERTYGDLRVRPELVAKIKDYAHEDLRNDVKLIATEENATAMGKRKASSRKKKDVVESIEVADAEGAASTHSIRRPQS